MQFPGLLLTFVYPWIAKPMLLPYVGGLPNATFVCEKLVSSFTNVPASLSLSTEVPEEAFALTVQLLLEANGLTLTAQQLAPLMVGIGTRGLADPDLGARGGVMLYVTVALMIIALGLGFWFKGRRPPQSPEWREPQ